MVSILFVDHRASKSTSKQRYSVQANMHLCNIFNAAKQAHLKGRAHKRSRQAKVRHGLLVIIPLGEGAKRTTLVCAEESHTVDVTGVDPTETDLC